MTDFCKDALDQAQAKINDAMAPLIEQTAGIVQKMQAKDLDPRKFYDAKNDQIIDMVALLGDLVDTRNVKMDALRDEVESKCEQTVGFVQTMLDEAVRAYSLGLSEVLPKHMSHIDVGAILAGKVLGGDNSVFNQVRDEVFFTAIGIDANSPLGRAVSNPFAGTNAKDGVNQLLEQWGLPFRL